MFLYLFIFLLAGALLIFKFKSVFLKFILFVYWYPLLTMFMFCVGIPLGGSIDVIGRPAHEEYCEYAFIMALLGYFVFVFVIWKLKDSYFSFKRVQIGGFSRVILTVVLLLVAVIAYPKAFGIGSARWNLVPGPWVVLFLSLNTILLLSFNGLKTYSTILHLFVVALTMAGGERVNSIFVIVMLILLEFSWETNQIKERKLNPKLILSLLVVVVIGIIAGIQREGGSFTILRIAFNVLSVHTVRDVVHIYFSSFGYNNDVGLNFYPLLNEIASVFNIPGYGGAGVDISYNFTEILRDYIYNYGGGLFYSEGVVVFGAVGVLIYGFCYGLLFRLLFKYQNIVVSTIFVVLLVLQMRLQWYGLVYIYMPIFFTLLVIYFLKMIKDRSRGKILNSKT